MNLDDLTVAELEELLMKIESVKEFEKYNKLYYFKPYEYQAKFMKAGEKHKTRLMRAANQVGGVMTQAALA